MADNPQPNLPQDENLPQQAGADLTQKNFENQQARQKNIPSENQPEDIFAEVDPTEQNQPLTPEPPPQEEESQDIPNPQPPPQPEAAPPQQDVEQQSSTGLEAQPVLSEEYVPEPDYQKARIPKGRPFLKTALIIIAILIIIGGGIFFLLFFGKGTLKLTVNPPEAQVKIDDQEQQTKITYEVRLPVGEHVLNVALDGYVEYNKKININGFRTTEINVDLHQVPQAQRILDEAMEFISLSPDKKYVLGYGKRQKTFYRIPIAEENQNQGESENQEEGSQEVTTISSAQAITETDFANIVSVIWNPAKELAILKVKNEEDALKDTDFWREKSGNGTITTWLYDFSRYDLANQESKYLGDDISSITWTPDGEKIIYYSIDKKSVYQANSDNSDREVIKNIQDIRNANLTISPDGKFLALVPRSTKFQENYLYQIELYSKDLLKINEEGNQKGAVFNTESNKILYSTYSQDPASTIYTTLSIVDVGGENNNSLDIRALIEKTRFLDENNFLYATLTDQTQSEVLKKFNLESGEEHDYFLTSEETLRFDNIVLTENKDKIYFLSENLLYQLDLITDEYES